MSKDSLLNDYVYLIAELPLRPPILLESQKELLLIMGVKSFYLSISLWLRNIMLKEALLPEAYEGHCTVLPTSR